MKRICLLLIIKYTCIVKIMLNNFPRVLLTIRGSLHEPVLKRGTTSRKLLRKKVTPDLHLTYSKNRGKPRVGIENEKYSLSLNFIDKTCKIYLFIFVLCSIVAFKAN